MSKTPSKPPPLLITGGADSFVKMWIPTDSEADNGGAAWERESKLEGHQDWITDLAWAPSVGVRVRHMLASAGRDRKVILWTQPSPSAVWVPMLLTQARDTPWSLSFSITGHMLTVAEADGRLTLWRENQGNWEEARFTKKIRDYHVSSFFISIFLYIH
jgi:protein transport protein SEC13